MSTVLACPAAARPPAGGSAAVARRLMPRRLRWLGPVLHAAYALRSRRLRECIRWALLRLEGGTPFSVTLRAIFRTYHGVEVGMYTHGAWNEPFHLGEGTVVGRYCSIADTARVITHNHPLDRRSTSGLFFHPYFGLAEESVEHATVTIGNDVWIGHNATVMPSVRSIGDGAVIGTGAVVTRSVPPYAIVAGHPARVVGHRFPPDVVAELLASRWWDRPLAELANDRRAFQTPIAACGSEARGTETGT